MHIQVHRPVICGLCRAEMPAEPGPQGWFHCLLCGTERKFE